MKRINGNFHSNEARVTLFGLLKTVVEPEGETTIRITVYKGDDEEPIATELYGYDPDVS